MEGSGWWQSRPTLPTTWPRNGGEEGSGSDETIPLLSSADFRSMKLTSTSGMLLICQI